MLPMLPPLEGEFLPAGGPSMKNSGATLLKDSVEYQKQTTDLFSQFMDIQKQILDCLHSISVSVEDVADLMVAESRRQPVDDLMNLENEREQGRGKKGKGMVAFKETSTLEKLLKNLSAFLELTLFPLLIAFAAGFNAELVPWLAGLAGLRILMRTTGVTFADLGKSLKNIAVSFGDAGRALTNSMATASDKLAKWATTTFKPAADSKLGKMLTDIANWFTRATARAEIWFQDVQHAWQKTTKLFKSIANAFRSAGNLLMEMGGKIGKMIQPVIQWAQDLWTLLSKVFSSVGKATNILSKILGPLTKIIPGLLKFVAWPVALLATAYDTVTGFMEGFNKDGLIGGIAGAAEKLLAGTVGIVFDLLTEIASWIADALGFENLAGFLDEISFDEIWTRLKDGVQEMLSQIIEFVIKAFKMSPIGQLIEGVTDLLDGDAPTAAPPLPPIAPVARRAGVALAASNEETATMKAEREAAAARAVVNTQVATNQTNINNNSTVMADASFSAAPPTFGHTAM